ncbi:hypothetical protein Xaut_3800 [Xanthobacter versatilis]|uniref:Uncharacterized protein n=1 Tax=Xanthobacter autotrophicus (strain ATCC BAA-1158 / Py2) TaxID=78245 RepID=A7ILY2_XANP2|nr:hypothetical protein Xaut_3800 [Xanthobacter autotrophicus Py2]
MRSCRQHEPTARKHEKQPEQFVVVFDAIRRLARDVRPLSTCAALSIPQAPRWTASNIRPRSTPHSKPTSSASTVVADERRIAKLEKVRLIAAEQLNKKPGPNSPAVLSQALETYEK